MRAISKWKAYEKVTALSEKRSLLGGQGHEGFGELDYFSRQVPGGGDGR